MPKGDLFIDHILGILSDDAAVIVDADNRVIEKANRAAEMLLGHCSGAMQGLPVSEILVSDDSSDSFNAEVVNSMALGRRHRGQCTLKRSDGSVFDAIISVQRILEGRPEHLGIIRDVSKYQATEKRLAESEFKSQTIIEASPAAMHFYELTDNGLVFTGGNPAADQMLGAGHTDLLGMTIEEAFPGLDESVHAALYRAAEKGERYHIDEFDYHGRNASGTFELAAFRYAPRQIAVAFSDVSERKRIKAKEARYRARLSAMAAELTAAEARERRALAESLHDRVGQPLAMARLHLKSAYSLEHGVDPGSLVQAEELLEDAIAQTRNITTSLCPPVIYEIGLGAALCWLAEDLSQHYDMTINLDLSADETGVDIDDKMVLFRAAHELSLNVLRHAGTNEAWMTLKSVDGHLALVVEDHGQGFEPEILDGGTGTAGFGLFSLKERVPHLGGRFEAHSTPDGGTRILVSVPQKTSDG